MVHTANHRLQPLPYSLLNRAIFPHLSRVEDDIHCHSTLTNLTDYNLRLTLLLEGVIFRAGLTRSRPPMGGRRSTLV